MAYQCFTAVPVSARSQSSNTALHRMPYFTISRTKPSFGGLFTREALFGVTQHDLKISIGSNVCQSSAIRVDKAVKNVSHFSFPEEELMLCSFCYCFRQYISFLPFFPFLRSFNISHVCQQNP